jgi:hypothetical protein
MTPSEIKPSSAYTDAYGRVRVVRYLCDGERVSYLLPGADPIYGLCALDAFAAQCTAQVDSAEVPT